MKNQLELVPLFLPEISTNIVFSTGLVPMRYGYMKFDE